MDEITAIVGDIAFEVFVLLMVFFENVGRVMAFNCSYFLQHFLIVEPYPFQFVNSILDVERARRGSLLHQDLERVQGVFIIFMLGRLTLLRVHCHHFLNQELVFPENIEFLFCF